MAGSDGKEGSMFFEAIKRNSNLLLVQGVGYVGDGTTTRDAKLKKNQPTLFQLSLGNKQKKLLAKIVTNHPNLLQLDVDSNLRSTAQFLRDYCDLTDSELATVVGSNPSILGLAVDGNLRPKMQLLTMFLKRARNKAAAAAMDYFDDIDVKSNTGKSDNTLAVRLLATAPSVMDNIQQTLSFYNMTGYIDLPNKEGMTTENAGNVRSRYIATSLYNRLLPRWNFLLKEQERKEQLLGVLAAKTDDTSRAEATKYHLPSSKTPRDKVLLPPIHLLAGASDEVFCRQLNLSLSEYSAFKEEAAPRLKFNSQFELWLKTGRPIDMITL
ncbi:hypothetical protein QTG54_008399 [Skeletonema marinoi]|uniref:Uncharacterized protein n=1 Tax=Skeletonema marinoi TaxID=267567 RepID=A0AAD9DBE9_9STRA|nr:hypothetical protein QTG54_008399 [Skeletonema marinoi]